MIRPVTKWTVHLPGGVKAISPLDPSVLCAHAYSVIACGPHTRMCAPPGCLDRKHLQGWQEKVRETFLSFSASRKIRAGSVVIAWSWATALFAQTTAEPLNGGLGLSQAPEHTTGGEERRSVRPPCVCVCIWVCLKVFPTVFQRGRSLAGTPLLTLLIAGSWSRSVFA